MTPNRRSNMIFERVRTANEVVKVMKRPKCHTHKCITSLNTYVNLRSTSLQALLVSLRLKERTSIPIDSLVTLRPRHRHRTSRHRRRAGPDFSVEITASLDPLHAKMRPFSGRWRWRRQPSPIGIPCPTDVVVYCFFFLMPFVDTVVSQAIRILRRRRHSQSEVLKIVGIIAAV